MRRPLSLRAPHRGGWLILSALVAIGAVAALFTLNNLENEARANEQIARRYIARLDQTISELTPLGAFLSQRNPKLLSRLISTGASVGRSDRLAVMRVDRGRAMEIEQLIAELIRDAADDSTDLVRAAMLTGRARFLADEIATREQRRADRAERLSLYGSAIVVLLALASVGGLVARERRSTLRAAQLHAAELRHLAEHDGLTGLANRRAFDAELERFHQRPSSQTVEIAVCDLDGLKTVNDRDGHHHGDQLLIDAADALREAVGTHGTVFRTGGDEFCVISTPGSSITHAVRRAMSGEGSTATGSFGVAHWPSDDTDAASVVRLADERMYAAKRARAPVSVARP
ncbi:MAG: GGDEF domain-containing protein [Solirubrobacteraceae bacterium]|nr:GGDEF domain-containing protein [Solirubrobacteraceae bacterium]